MKTLPILLISLWWTAVATADNLITLKDGRTLKNIWLLSIGMDTVTVWHGGREEVVRQDLLPDVERLKLVPSVEALKQMITEDDAAYAARIARSKASGGKFTTISGKFYEGVRLKDVAVDHLFIVHASGSARIGLEDLPPEIRLSLKTDIAAVQATAEVMANQRLNDPGEQEWRKALQTPGGMKAQQLTMVVVQQMASGVIVERVTSRPDITPGLYAYLEGVTGWRKGMLMKTTVIRSGVWTDAHGKGWPKYRSGK